MPGSPYYAGLYGIVGFGEIPGVLNLEVRIPDTIPNDGYRSISTPTAIRGSVVELRWDNMFGHIDIPSGHPYADGDTRPALKDDWDKISEYVIFVFKPTPGTTNDPENDFPADDDANGTWSEAMIVPALQVSFADDSSKPYIDANIDCPRGETLSFWVGARSIDTISSSDSVKKGLAPKGLTV